MSHRVQSLKMSKFNMPRAVLSTAFHSKGKQSEIMEKVVNLNYRYDAVRCFKITLYSHFLLW